MSRIKNCAECVGFDAMRLDMDSDEDFVALIEHYLLKHPESERFKSVLDSFFIRAECANCGSQFKSPVEVGESGLIRPRFCEDCMDENPMRKLQVTSVDTSEFVAQAEEWVADAE